MFIKTRMSAIDSSNNKSVNILWNRTVLTEQKLNRVNARMIIIYSCVVPTITNL